ncbi:MAG: hypothetical protein M1826_004319 [Phylliscum demangeonii]|nr:MAG: hypothetical protein M1826_004319 [Phylliscum demangeonii]
MPGVIPLKLISLGSATSSRIAQACDRCRSKKIRCDGERPTCTQCAVVGFECRTSDKLSRRAFPRGYTESLEERVRALEAEVRELKDQLDERDEKMDMLSKMRAPPDSAVASAASAASAPRGPALPGMFPPSLPPSEGGGRPASGLASVPGRDVGVDLLPLPEMSGLVEDGMSEAYFVGSSSDRAMVAAFARQLDAAGRPGTPPDPDRLLARPRRPPPSPPSSPQTSPRTTARAREPPRLVSDQLINIFFQEWAPIFPVLHRPSLLAAYHAFCAHPDAVTDPHTLAQLYLVFSIAAIAGERTRPRHVPGHGYEPQWRAQVERVAADRSLATLQCFVLAQLFFLATGRHESVQPYRALAAGLSHRLGLHQRQHPFALPALACETRKRTFWCLYTLDCVAAAVLGLPRFLHDADVHTEYPADVDDDALKADGADLDLTLADDGGRMAGALAAIRASRILARALETLYPAGPSSGRVSIQAQRGLERELQDWWRSLPSPLRLPFEQGKPAARIVSSSSPLLTLIYHHVRTLIHRPLLSCGVRDVVSAAVDVIADGGKKTIQIVQLMEERQMTFVLCLSKHDLLVTSGLALLWHALDVDPQGKLIKDHRRLINVALEMLERDSAAAAPELRRIAHAVIPAVDAPPPPPPAAVAAGARPAATTSASASASAGTSAPKAGARRLQLLASRFYRSNARPTVKSDDRGRRQTTPTSFPTMSSPPPPAAGRAGMFPPPMPAGRPEMHRLALQHSMMQRMSPLVDSSMGSRMGSPMGSSMGSPMGSSMGPPTLDYLHFATEPLSSDPQLSAAMQGGLLDPSAWKVPRPAPSPLSLHPSGPLLAPGSPAAFGAAAMAGWPTDLWHRGGSMPPLPLPPPPQPLLSYSSENSLATTDGHPSPCDLVPPPVPPYPEMLLPPTSMGDDEFPLHDFDGHLGL